MNNEKLLELLKILNDKYETTLAEDKELSREFEQLIQERDELCILVKLKN